MYEISVEEGRRKKEEGRGKNIAFSEFYFVIIEYLQLYIFGSLILARCTKFQRIQFFYSDDKLTLLPHSLFF
ncbi:hypothetical protein [Okeania sp. SIO1I7]|uniref:hypothetical protein n=1 Tax=Okeania sp. SIO1I7 TaxID=2607772 RepID=UPI0013F88A54|nr:hypothetical protein [Okeania sp. SIO1I7]NET29010.1 hypothetical protein [Okeania sp. SIO1I7]